MKVAILPEDLVAVADTDLYLCLSYSLDHSFFYVFVYLRQTYYKTFLFALFDFSLEHSPSHSYSSVVREGSFTSSPRQIGATILRPSMSAIVMSAAESMPRS